MSAEPTPDWRLAEAVLAEAGTVAMSRWLVEEENVEALAESLGFDAGPLRGAAASVRSWRNDLADKARWIRAAEERRRREVA